MWSQADADGPDAAPQEALFVGATTARRVAVDEAMRWTSRSSSSMLLPQARHALAAETLGDAADAQRAG